jgi:hypothetical protein
VGRRPLRADHLPDLALPEPADDGRADEEGEQQGRDHRAGGPEAQIVEEIEDEEMLPERGKQVIEHRPSVR